MSKFKEVDSLLKNLELKKYPIIYFAELIVEILSLQKEGLFDECPLFNSNAKWKDNFYDENQLNEKIDLTDCVVDLTYQRLLRLKKLIDHLRSLDLNGNDLKFDKMCAGAIDIAIRPDDDKCVWDGFRRSVIAILNGIRYVKVSVEKHPRSFSIEKCRAVEAYAFKKRNGDNEPMGKDELYKSGIAFENPKDLETKRVLTECKLDVLKTISDADKTMDGFAEFEASIHDNKIDAKHLITASRIIRKSWEDDTTVSSYVLCGLANYIQLEEMNALSWSNNITGFDGCDILPLMKKFAEENTQGSLTTKRISGYGIATISFRIAYRALKITDMQEQVELATKLGFDEDGTNQVVISSKFKSEIG